MARTSSLSPRLMRKLDRLYGEAPLLRLPDGGQAVVFSDLHLGDGGADDDFARNAPILRAILGDHYEKQKSILVLNGDIEELARFSLASIATRWLDVYALWSRFAARGALFKLAGNHDLALLRRRIGDLPFPVGESLRLEIGDKRFWIFHGHQVSRLDWVFQTLGTLLLRWLLHPLGIGNYTVARSSRKRFNVERRAYLYARSRRLAACIGHTHRPLFESLPRLDAVKMEIESLVRRYPAATAEEEPALREQLTRLKQEHIELQRSEGRRGREGLYGEGPLLPCLFNSGCGIGSNGVTAIEIDARQVRLVYWFDSRRSSKYIEAEGYRAEPLAGSEIYRVILKEEELDYIFTRINLLG